MHEPVPLIDVPKRIIQRYVENTQFLVKSVKSIFQSKQVTEINESSQDTYGFKKTLLLLTEPGKLYALSALDGSFRWSYFNPQEPILKVFVE